MNVLIRSLALTGMISCAFAQQPITYTSEGSCGEIGEQAVGNMPQLHSFSDPAPWLHGYHTRRPAYSGFNSFRPYNYRHVGPQTYISSTWGNSPGMPYQLNPGRWRSTAQFNSTAGGPSRRLVKSSPSLSHQSAYPLYNDPSHTRHTAVPQHHYRDASPVDTRRRHRQ